MQRTVRTRTRTSSCTFQSPTPIDHADNTSNLLADIAHIYIHGQDKPITVHLGLLTRSSQWLAARLDENRTINFDENFEPQTIKMFIVWLYSSTLMPPMVVEPDRPQEPYPAWNETTLANLYTFASLFDIGALKNDVITILVQNYAPTSEFTTLPTISQVVDQCGADCCFVQFLAYHRASRGLREVSQLPDDLVDYPSAFLAAVLQQYVHFKQLRENKLVKVGFSAELPCRWHEHATEAEKDRCIERLVVNAA